MQIRPTTMNDLESVQTIYTAARKFMRQNGNQVQWVNGYPSEKLLIEDIQTGISYVCEDEGLIVGTFAFILGKDPTYAQIYDGNWLNEEMYGVVHRLGALPSAKGVGTFCLEWCFDQMPNIRIDTHEANIPMQNLLMKLGYQKCGVIYVADGTPRVAFQKI